MNLYRLAWKHDDTEGRGGWSNNPERVTRSVEFGNQHHGAGTHWLEEWKGTS